MLNIESSLALVLYIIVCHNISVLVYSIVFCIKAYDEIAFHVFILFNDNAE